MKNLKYVKIIKIYKILTQIHLNYRFKKITLKNFQIHGLCYCLAKGVKILDSMKCSPLLAPIPPDTWKSEIQLGSGIIIMLFLLSYEVYVIAQQVHLYLNTYTHKYIFSENTFFLMEPT